MPRTPGRFLAGVALDLDESYERVTHERPRHLPRRGRQLSPQAVDYGRQAEQQKQKKAKAQAEAADQAQQRTVKVAWARYPPVGVGRKPRKQATPSTGTPGVEVWESDDWRNLNNNTPPCTALEKMAKFKQEKAELRSKRRSGLNRNGPSQFRPSWMQIDKPKRKPGEGLPTTSLPQASLKSKEMKEKEEENRRRSRRRLKASSRLSPLASRLEGGEEVDWSEMDAFRKKVKKMSKQIRSGSRLLTNKKMKRDLF